MKYDRPKCENKNCCKEIYNTEEEASAEIRRIIETQRKITDIKPCRSFHCDCGYWALTSKIKIY